MFRQNAQRRGYIEDAKKGRGAGPGEGIGDSPMAGGPGIGPGAEADVLAGDESAFDPGAMAAHHQKMADFHVEQAGPVEGSPEEEAGELPDFEAKEDETPPEAAPGHADVETPEEEAGELPDFEDEEDKAKAGGGLRNAKGGNPLSRFNEMRKGKG